MPKWVRRELGLASLAFLGCFLIAEAAFLRNVPVSLKQPDGTTLDCLASGDEFYNWLHDQDGYTILRDPETGFLVYAGKADGRLVPTPFIAGKTSPLALAQAGLEKRLLDDRAVRDRRMFLEADEPIVNVPRTGTINNLVVSIRFSDQTDFTQADADSAEVFFNSSVPGENSFRNYFYEASYSQLTIESTFYPRSTPEIFSYQDAHPRTYYIPYDATTNPEGYSGDTERRTREHTLLQNAVNAIAAEVPAGLDIDADADGYVDNICFIVKGGPTAWNTLLWPHKWALYSYSVYINAKRVYTYNFQMETTLDVGVLCHEMFHSLGAPDLYHYNSSYSYLHPVWAWDLMEYQTDPPQHMGAYMKFKYGGWISAIPEITSSGTYTLSPLKGATNNCYRIASPFSSTEFFIVEYRRREGTFEGSLYGQGLLVYRINSSFTGNANGPPDEVYIYRPNGTTTVEGSPVSAVFSSNAGRTAINDTTNPASFLTAGSAGGLNIRSVGATNATILFDVILERLMVTSPNGGEAWNAGDSVTVSWTSSGTIGSVDILLSSDGGSSWTMLADNTANDGTETLTAPSVSSPNCLIRIAEGASGTIFDDSNATFTIIFVTDSITVTDPDGGEAWVVGSSRNITWTSTGAIENVAIEYTINGGQNWLPAVAATANSGSWTWTIPSSPSESCLVRVTDASDAQTSDTSNTLFSIVTAAAILTADFNNDGQEDLLWRYQGEGEYRGWNVVWLMSEGQEPGPNGVRPMLPIPGAEELHIAHPGKSLKTPFEIVSVKTTSSVRSLRTPLGNAKVRLAKAKGLLRSAIGPDRAAFAKAKGRVRAEMPGIARMPINMTTAISSGSTSLAALGISDYYYLNIIQDLSWEIAGTGDFDGNGSTDILWRNYGTGAFSGWNVIWYMTGGSTLGFGYLYGISDLNWRIAGTGDFDKDGDIDILWRNYGTGDFSGWNVIWYMEGEGISGHGYLYGISDLNWQIAGTGDFDRDGDIDILWRNYGTGNFSGWNVIWYMEGEGISGYGYLNGISDLGWQIAGTGDFDNNGHRDIIWRNYGTGTYSGWNCIWYMQGEGIIGYDYPSLIPDLNWRIVNR